MLSDVIMGLLNGGRSRIYTLKCMGKFNNQKLMFKILCNYKFTDLIKPNLLS